ncbi:MAG: sigma-70 family RNA polymerase sigma factor [Anaerolineales bacterium]|nr:sigma-70 family RNA polymerase sigma factor [Anaerolineales bacterium]
MSTMLTWAACTGIPGRHPDGANVPDSDSEILITIERLRRIAGMLIRKFGIDRQEGDDLIGDGCLALVQCMRNYDDRIGVKFWTFAESRIRGSMIDGIRTRNKSRSQSRPQHTIDVGLIGEQLPDRSRSPIDEFLDESNASEIETLMKRLNCQERLVLYLRFWEDKTGDQVAQIIGTNPSRVSQIQTAAVCKLRRKLGVRE